MRRVIFNQKGGVGKSSITVNLAAISAARGLRTLVVDLDPQCNASQYLLGPAFQAVDSDIADYFEQTLSFRFVSREAGEFVNATPYAGLDLVPASPLLAEMMGRLESRHKIFKLREMLDDLAERYDAVFVDTPPAYNFYTLSALIAADACLIPFDCDDFSRRALYSLLDNVGEVQADHNGSLQVEGIVVNQYQPRARLPQQMVEDLRAEGLPILRTRLSASVKMRESHQQSKPLLHLAPKHKLTTEFQALYEELRRPEARASSGDRPSAGARSA